MIVPGAELKIYIATRPVDFRWATIGLPRRCRRCLVSTRSAVRPSCVPVETGGPDQDPGLGSNGPGAGAQAPRGLQVRMAKDCGRRDPDIAGDVRGVVRGPGLPVGPPGRSDLRMVPAVEMCSTWRMSTATLRDDNERLKALLAQTQAALSEHQATLATSEERRRLEVILGELRREKFGAKSEKLRPGQYHLPFEDVEIAQGVLDAAQEKAAAIIRGRSRAGSDQDRHRNRGLPICRRWSGLSSLLLLGDRLRRSRP